MIDCVTASNAQHYTNALHQMFQRRHDVFVKARGWSDLAHDGDIEKDQFDTDRAVYLLSIREDGVVCGGLRLLPTTGPHLLSEVFPQFAVDGVPRGPHIYEMTRYFTIRDRNEPLQMRRVAGELLCAMFEFGLAKNTKWITTLLDSFYLRRMRQNNWNEVALGPAMAYAEGTAIAIKFAVSKKNLESTRLAHGVPGPVLHLSEPVPWKRRIVASGTAALAHQAAI